jgi:hypothetical protein
MSGRFLWYGFLLCCSVAIAVVADESAPIEGDGSPDVSTLPHREVPIEEIVIRGERSPRLWRMHIERAEDDLYQLFNSLVDNRDYRVNCNRQPPTGSYIPIRHCEPNFVARERARNARNVVADWRSGDEDEPLRVMRDAINNNVVTEAELQADLVEKYDSMNQYMLELALENPELMAALRRLGELQAAYRQHAQ